MVKSESSTLAMRVRFPLLAPTGDLHNDSADAFGASGVGLIPSSPANLYEKRKTSSC